MATAPAYSDDGGCCGQYLWLERLEPGKNQSIHDEMHCAVTTATARGCEQCCTIKYLFYVRASYVRRFCFIDIVDVCLPSACVCVILFVVHSPRSQAVVMPYRRVECCGFAACFSLLRIFAFTYLRDYDGSWTVFMPVWGSVYLLTFSPPQRVWRG